jgi:hypothetical protein
LVIVSLIFCIINLFYSNVSEYAQVTKMLGNGRLEAMCFDDVKRLCHIRGKLRKKVGSVTNILYAFCICYVFS